MEVYTAKLGFIWAVTKKGMWGWNFLLHCVHYIPLLMLFNIELLIKEKKLWGGGGGGK